jgi:hypothetical protein
MDNFKLYRIIYGLGFLFLVLVSCTAIITHILNYNQLINFILNEINRKDLYIIITKKYFSETKFIVVKKIFIGISLVSFIGMFFYFKHRSAVLKFLELIIKKLQKRFCNFIFSASKNNPIINKLIIISILSIFARSIYYAIDFDIQFDEAWNYNYFLHNNIIYSFFVYNNYPLHNIVTWLFLKVLPDNTFTIRLPSILVGLLCCLTVFVVIKKFIKNQWIALGSMLVFSSLPIVIEYMLRSRGVIFEVFFILIIFYFLTTYLSEKITFNRILFISFLNALGTFSMLSHAYFILFSSLGFLLFLLVEKRNKELKYVCSYGLLSIVFSLILLLPMLLGTGILLGINAGISHSNFLALHYLNAFECYSTFLFGYRYFIIAYIFIIAFLLFNKDKQLKVIAFFNISFVSAVFLIPLFTKTTPPERTMGMLIILPITLIPLLITFLKQNWIVGIGVSYCMFLNYSICSNSEFIWSKKLDNYVLIVSNQLLINRIHKITSKTDLFNYFIPGVTYNYFLQNQKLEIITNNINSTRYSKQETNFECVVTNKNDTTTYGALIYEGYEIKIYKNIND